jgi:parallel beta-helix repeat protein
MAMGAVQIGPASKAYADQQGALAVGQTNYAVPAGAFFVSPTGTDASAGTQTAPWRTLTHAVNTAPSGSTIVIRGGTYGEQVNVLRSLTIQPYPGEKVWLTGSDVVTGWVADAGAWRKDGWTPSFTRADSSTTVAIDPAYPLAGWPEMVFVNGAALRQVASRAEVGTGTFYVDDAGNRLYIGTDPTGRLVEASARGEALSLRAPGSVVRGLGFRHYATPFAKMGAVKGYADRVVFENNVFLDNALAGLSVIGADAKVVRNTMAGNGKLGFHSHLSDRLVVEGNRVVGNNTERFHIAQAAGGAKITTSRDILVRANTMEENHGNGLWFDMSVYGADVVGNLLRNNYRGGLQFEVSANALVASNVIVGNRERGIYVLDSSDVEIWNNTLSRNGRNIFVLEGNRTSTVDPAITWDVARVNIRNNVLSESTATSNATLLGVDDARKLTSGAGMGVTADYDAFYRVSATSPSWVGVWSNWPTSMLVATTLDKFRTMTGQEQHGMLAEGGANPFIADENAGNYALPSTSPAWEKGSPLPARVASAMGVAAGVPVNIGVLVQPFRSAAPPPPPPNQAPVANFVSTCNQLTCTFDGKNSTDSDGTITAWSWSFGDNTSGSGVASSHTYAAAGSFTATLTLTDDKGAKATASQTVSPSLPPVPSAPTIALTGLTWTSVSLAWNAPSGADTYEVQRSTTGGATWVVAASGLTVRSFTDSGLTRNTAYQYRVRAKNASGFSPYSAVLSVKTKMCGAC